MLFTQGIQIRYYIITPCTAALFCSPSGLSAGSPNRVCAVARAITSGDRRGVTGPPSCLLVDRTAQGGALILVQTITHDAADLKHMRVDAIHRRYPDTLLYSFALSYRSWTPPLGPCHFAQAHAAWRLSAQTATPHPLLLKQ